jgi:putative PIN family toxin of toxin-antitoxin system
MARPEIVIDTNVMVAGLRSKSGASFRLLQAIATGTFGINVSVPLVLEYEDVLLRPDTAIPLPQQALEAVIDYHCATARHHEIFFLWRPFLPDPKDDMVLELAVAARCTRIVTFNKRDFRGVEQFGINVRTPAEFLSEVEPSRERT